LPRVRGTINGKFCYQHEPMIVPRTRGKKIA
jgi:hypothetical protein